MGNQVLTKIEMNCQNCEFCTECSEKIDECVKSSINEVLSRKSFNHGYREAIIRTFGLDGKEKWNVVQLAMYLKLSMDDAVHFFARAMRLLRSPSCNKSIKKFDIWACKHPNSPYAELVLKVLGIADTEAYLLYTEGVEVESFSGEMNDEKFEKVKKIRRARYKYMGEIKKDGLSRIAYEIEEIKKGANILSTFERESILLDNTLMEEFKNIADYKAICKEEIKNLFEDASHGSVDAVRTLIERCKVYALLVCKEFFLKPNEDLGFSTKELIDIAYQGLERTVYLYAQYKKPTDNFIEDLATLWIWSEFSKVILSKLSLKEGINC